jgi:hypothetical protein
MIIELTLIPFKMPIKFLKHYLEYIYRWVKKKKFPLKE